ncbi:MAG: hypothetical protein IT290_11770 [Deltaproteobacteria bacterium]|nr:hypothetical protein [Deltaproteobacteria bacterium]
MPVSNATPPRTSVSTGIILGAALLRLLPHLPNFTPVTALAFFGGARFGDRKHAILVVFAAMFLSDLIIGFDIASPFVYLALFCVVLIGELCRRSRSVAVGFAGIVSSTLVFFLVTNFGVWATADFYPKTGTGLLSALAAGLPFLRNSLLADLFFSAVMFGCSYIAEKGVFPVAQRRVA